MQKEQQTAPEMEEEQEYLTQTPSIQWFPGHMAKTRRVMKESLGLVDIVVELRDARIPKSSRNPEIEKIIGDKPRLVVFNKADIADPAVTKQWQEYYKSHGVRTWRSTAARAEGSRSWFLRCGRCWQTCLPNAKPRGCRAVRFA